MKSHLSLFHLYQSKARNNHPLNIYTRNNQMQLLSHKTSIMNPDKSAFKSIESLEAHSFRLQPKKITRNNSLSKAKVQSFNQVNNPIKPKPKAKSTYNNIIRNTYTSKNLFRSTQNSKKPLEPKNSRIFLNSKQIENFLIKKDNLKQVLYFPDLPHSFMFDHNSKCSNVNKKKSNISLNPESRMKMLKPIYSSHVELPSEDFLEHLAMSNKPKKDLGSSTSNSKRKENSNSKRSHDESGILSLEEVKDIVVYNDFNGFSKDWAYLFYKDDYETYIANKSENYLNAFFQ